VQPGEVRTPVDIAGHDLAIEHCRFGRLRSTCAMEGNRSVKSSSLRLKTTAREPTLCA
jgi:hypothetical protein